MQVRDRVHMHRPLDHLVSQLVCLLPADDSRIVDEHGHHAEGSFGTGGALRN